MGGYTTVACGRAEAREPAFGQRARRLLVTLTLAFGVALIIVAQASAFTLGVGWSNPAYVNSEMPQVAHSGAELFRLPLPPENNNDEAVRAAALNHVTIEANLGGGSSLPSGSARTTFITQVEAEVRRYGYGGDFWTQNPSLPYTPVTTWEVWNEENNQGIGPVQYGTFLNEVASAIQTASYSQSGRGSDVLSGGLLVWGNLGGTKGNWQERGPDTYNGSLRYLQEAYPYFGGVGSSVTGVAIHPYELEESSFYTPPGGSRYNRLQAFEYAVSGFHAALANLPESAEAPQLPLWITESGWPAEGPQYSVGQTEQANLLKATINYARANAGSLNLGGYLWYNIRDIPETGQWADYCGLRDHSGNYRQAWYAFQEETGAGRWPTAPAVETGSARVATETSAVLSGTVNPEGSATNYRFEYGTTESYGHSIPVSPAEVGAGGEPVAVSQTLTGLQARTHYHYRIVATNSYGSTPGADRTFTTGVKWLIRNSNTGGVPDADYWFGLPGRVEVVGDWNGDGKDTPGTYEPSTGIWRLRNANSSGGAEIEFQYGGSQFIPVVGDWDGNGTTTIGLYEPKEGRWELRNSNSSGNPNLSFTYGGSQFTPVVGDWDGNGTTTIGLYEPISGHWSLRNSNTSGNPDLSFQYGGSQYTPVVGDWDGNGTTTIGLYEPISGQWVLRNTNSSGNPDLSFQYGGSQYTPVVGDWDGNGTTTVGLVTN